jgi:hypothetical protein
MSTPTKSFSAAADPEHTATVAMIAGLGWVFMPAKDNDYGRLEITDATHIEGPFDSGNFFNKGGSPVPFALIRSLDNNENYTWLRVSGHFSLFNNAVQQLTEDGPPAVFRAKIIPPEEIAHFLRLEAAKVAPPPLVDMTMRYPAGTAAHAGPTQPAHKERAGAGIDDRDLRR